MKRRRRVHVVAAVYGPELREKQLEVAESGVVAVNPQIVGDLLHVLQRPQLPHPHRWNVFILIAEIHDAKKNRLSSLTHTHHDH